MEAWVEEYLTEAERESIFGTPADAGKATLNLTVSAEAKARLVRMRESTGKSISQIISDSVMK